MIKSVERSTVICVDRSIDPTYPLERSFNVHFRLVRMGPAEYDLTAIELFVRTFQQTPEKAEGKWLHEYLKGTRMIERCLDLRDAVEIQKLDVNTFRRIFGDSNVFFWRSTAQDRHGDEQVPYLCLREGDIVLGWRAVKEKWGASDITALFPKIAG